jgi:predicted RNA-binding Zn-ribbon protein involved in translation (DUF1610 family)
MSKHTVVCVSCGRSIYYFLGAHKFAGSRVEASHFEPIDDKVSVPEDNTPMICPKCGDYFPYILDPPLEGIVLKLEGGCWWPSPPVL